MEDNKKQVEEIFNEKQTQYINRQISTGLLEMSNVILKQIANFSKIIEDAYFDIKFCKEILATNPEVKALYKKLKKESEKNDTVQTETKSDSE